MYFADQSRLVTSWNFCIHLARPFRSLTTRDVGEFWFQVSSEYPSFRFCYDEDLNFQSDKNYLFTSKDCGLAVIFSEKTYKFRAINNYVEAFPFREHHRLAKESFNHFTTFFSRNSSEKNVEVERAELIFRGTVFPCQYWMNSFDTPHVFPLIKVIPLDNSLAHAPDFNFLITYRPESNVDLKIVLQTRHSGKDPDEAVLSFEYRAKMGRPPISQNQFWYWYIKAHQAIARCFSAMTNPYIRSVFWRSN